MRKTLARMLVMALLFTPFWVQAESFDTELIDSAKQALTLMSYGEYKKALKKLNFQEKMTAQDLAGFVEENLSDLELIAVQTDVAVAFRSGGSWFVAIPVEDPSYDTVETFILRAKDGSRFDACREMDWYEVQAMVDEADSVIWQDAYEESFLYAVPDAG